MIRQSQSLRLFKPLVQQNLCHGFRFHDISLRTQAENPLTSSKTDRNPTRQHLFRCPTPGRTRAATRVTLAKQGHLSMGKFDPTKAHIRSGHIRVAKNAGPYRTPISGAGRGVVLEESALFKIHGSL